jgi:hypothetical protein
MSDREPSSVRRCWVRLLGRSAFRAWGGVERNQKKAATMRARVYCRRAFIKATEAQLALLQIVAALSF